MLSTSRPRYSRDGGRGSSPWTRASTSSSDNVLPSILVVPCTPLLRYTLSSCLATCGRSGTPATCWHFDPASPSRSHVLWVRRCRSRLNVIQGCDCSYDRMVGPFSRPEAVAAGQVLDLYHSFCPSWCPRL